LDFGIVGKLKAESWRACMGMMQAMQDSDYQAMARHMVDMEMTHSGNQVDVSTLGNDLQRMMKTIMAEDKAFTSGVPFNSKDEADKLNKMMLEMLEVDKRHGIHFPRDFAVVTKQMHYFGRFMRTLAPNMDMFSDQRVQMLEQAEAAEQASNPIRNIS